MFIPPFFKMSYLMFVLDFFSLLLWNPFWHDYLSNTKNSHLCVTAGQIWVNLFQHSSWIKFDYISIKFLWLFIYKWIIDQKRTFSHRLEEIIIKLHVHYVKHKSPWFLEWRHLCSPFKFFNDNKFLLNPKTHFTDKRFYTLFIYWAKLER